MDNMSLKLDQDQHRRVKSSDFLFMTAPNLVNKEKLHGIGMGSQIKAFEDIFRDMEKREIYEIFRNYLKTKKMNLRILKDPHEPWLHVDKVYTEENNLIMIFSTENKFPAMDMYCTENLEALREDIKKYLNSQK